MLRDGGAGFIIAGRDCRYAESLCKERAFNLSKTKAPQVLDLRALCGNRGDSTPIELFVQGIRSWGPETRFLLAVKP